MAVIRLIGDIGGTNVRFALAKDGQYDHVKASPGQDYPSFEAAIADYLADLPADLAPSEAAFALAGPVEDDRVTLTNHPWSFSKSGLKSHFDFDRLSVLNDFTANAVALPYLEPADLQQIGRGMSKPERPRAILGPGTGLGVSGLIKGPDGQYLALEGEGGHVTMPARNERESRVLEILRRRFDHVSAERVLSGDGLVNLYEALCELDGRASAGYKPAQITDEAIGRKDPYCDETVTMFCAMLGTVASDLVLTLGAHGGLFIAGGIVPRLEQRFAASPFRERFENKGRFRSYLAPVPTFLITHKNPALVGLSRLP